MDKKESSDLAPALTDHHLLRRVGAGSYGEVWLARCALGAYRAVKIVRRATFGDNPRPYEREFAGLKRFEPISREHEGLVDVLQVGRDDIAGFFYCVMELADNAAGRSAGVVARGSDGNPAGPRPRTQRTNNLSLLDLDSYEPRTLAHEVKVRSPLSADEVVQLARALAEGLEFLHSKGLVHRDIKPSNIIFVNGVPKLADVGLVAYLNETHSLGGGTIGFMPPEGPGTVQADIYSLGKVIYEAATGKDRQEFPDLPTRLDSDNGESKLLELNEVILKACARLPGQRYRSAAEMLADLKFLQRGDSLRLARVRRRQARRAGAVAGLILGVAVVAGAAWALRHAGSITGQTSKPKVLFSDRFDSPRIDTNNWVWSTKEWPGVDNTGHREFRVDQTNGELVIQASAQHERGWTTYGAAWLDSKQDFRKYGDCRVDVDLSGTNQWGVSVLSMSEGHAPLDADDSSAVRLLSMPTREDTQPWGSPSSLVHGIVRIDLLASQQAAVVYPDARIPEHFEILSLASLAQWRLRFYAVANSSRDCPKGTAMFRLTKITILVESGSSTLVGHVLNAMTKSPIEAAIITDQTGARLAQTRPNGAFKLTTGSWPARIRAQRPGFSRSDDLLISSGAKGRGPIDIELRPQSFAVGDVVEVIPCAEIEMGSIGFRGTNMWVLGREIGKWQDSLMFPMDLGAKQLLTPAGRFRTGYYPLSAFAMCGERLVATSSASPGHIYDLTSGDLSPILTAREPATGRPITSLNACAFDGEFFWFVETTHSTNWFGLHAVDLESRTIKHSPRSADTNLCALAWDGDRKQFWLSNINGKFYTVSREAALRVGIKESDRGREFNGNYRSLAFGAGHLWGLERDKQQICKIKIRD